MQTGTYLDGTPWAVSGGTSLTVTGTLPASVQLDRLTEAGVATGLRQVHGAMLNPGNADLHGDTGDKSTLAGRQLRNYGQQAAGGAQGYDQFLGNLTNAGYSASKNVATGPVTLTEGTIVKAISVLSGVDSASRPMLTQLVPLTVVTSAPPFNAFAPAVASANKASLFTLDDLRMERLPNLSAAGLTTAVPGYGGTLSKLKFVTWQHTFNVGSRNILVNGAPVYGGDRFDYSQAMLGLCYDAWTTDQKQAIAIRLVQHGLHIAGRVLEGGVYPPNGGHGAFTKAAVVFAAYMLGEPTTLVDVVNMVTAGPSYAQNNPTGTSVWYDDQQIKLITPAIRAAHVGPLPYTADQDGWPEWIADGLNDGLSYTDSGDPVTIGTPYTSWQNHFGAGLNQNAGWGPNATYRHVIAAVNVPSSLALRLMGARSLYNYQPWFDYQDRHMAYMASGTIGDRDNPVLPFAKAAWALSRGTSGLWVP